MKRDEPSTAERKLYCQTGLFGFQRKVCSSVEYSDEQRFLADLKKSLYHGVPLCVVLYRDQNGKTISRTFLNDLDTLPKGLFVEDSSHRKPKERGEAR